MPDFNIDDFKKTWQEQPVEEKYGNSEILEMLNKKSRNYVKYIFWISIAEFLFFLGITIFYLLKSEDTNSFIRVLERIGVQKTVSVEKDFAHLYFVLKMISLAITAIFVIKFYNNYKKIKIEANVKNFILQIINFRKTVNLFILTNIVLLILFTGTLTVFVFRTLAEQNVHLDNPTLTGFLIGIVFTLLLSVALIWIYYRLVYGIILSRLGRNLEQLKKIEANE